MQSERTGVFYRYIDKCICVSNICIYTKIDTTHTYILTYIHSVKYALYSGQTYPSSPLAIGDNSDRVLEHLVHATRLERA